VHDVGGVRGVQGGRGVVQPLHRRPRVDPLAAAQLVGHGAARQELHDHERAPVVLPDVVDRHDVRVV
jgi:hypothetical protein